MKHECFNVVLQGKTMVSRQTFDGTNELAKYIKTAPISKVWNGCSLHSEGEKDYGFNDFDSLESATEALEYGTDIYYKDFKKNIKKSARDYKQKRKKQDSKL